MTLPSQTYDGAEVLYDLNMVLGYFQAGLDDSEDDMKDTLDVCARAIGMNYIAKKTGIPLDDLYAQLHGDMPADKAALAKFTAEYDIDTTTSAVILKHPEKQEDWKIYPAIFTYDDGYDIAVEFPDLGVATNGKDEADALGAARELLGCVIFGLEEDGAAIPQPSLLKNIQTADNERASLIEVYMPPIRQAQSIRDVSE